MRYLHYDNLKFFLYFKIKYILYYFLSNIKINKIKLKTKNFSFFLNKKIFLF